jgi:hypothetical protein
MIFGKLKRFFCKYKNMFILICIRNKTNLKKYSKLLNDYMWGILLGVWVPSSFTYM